MDAQRDEEATSKGHADWRRAAMHGVLCNEKGATVCHFIRPHARCEILVDGRVKVRAACSSVPRAYRTRGSGRGATGVTAVIRRR